MNIFKKLAQRNPYSKDFVPTPNDVTFIMDLACKNQCDSLPYYNDIRDSIAALYDTSEVFIEDNNSIAMGFIDDDTYKIPYGVRDFMYNSLEQRTWYRGLTIEEGYIKVKNNFFKKHGCTDAFDYTVTFNNFEQLFNYFIVQGETL